MYPWSEKRILWYQRAVAHQRFDAALGAALMPYLPLAQTVCDLGCGTGYLAMYLAGQGYQVTAFDRSSLTMDFLRQRRAALGLSSLQLRTGDWNQLQPRPYWDNVVMVFAGHLDTDLDRFLAFAGKRLLLVLKDETQSHVQDTGVGSRLYVTAEQVGEELKRRGYRYAVVPFTAEFGQPLQSVEEARDYLRTFGADPDSAQSAMGRLVQTQDPDYPLLLPNQKCMNLVAVQTGRLSTTEILDDVSAHHQETL